MAQTFTETVGMLNLVIGHLDNPANAAALAAKGMDVPLTKTRLTTKKNNIVQLDAQQEQAKVVSQDITKLLDPATEDAYTDASGMVDAVAGFYGKTTPAGKNILGLRANIRRGSGPDPTTPPPPPTP